MDIAKFFYQLNKLGFHLRLEDNKLKYKQYERCDREDQIIAEIKSNKDNIIEFLNINRCYSPDLPYKSYIYKSNNKKSPLSFAQERLWFIEQYEEGSNAYNIPMVFKLSNGVDLAILENSIRSIVTRHEILRTLIKQDREGNRYQLIVNDKEYPLEVIKIDVLDRIKLDQEIEKQVNYIYDLSNEYPIRPCLYSLVSNISKNYSEYYLSIVIHHIAFDGWSVDIFLEELQEFYNYHSKKNDAVITKLNLPELTIQYKDFALWQRSYLSGEILDKQLRYWKEKLSNYETLNLVSCKPRLTQINYAGKNIYFKLEEDISNNLRRLAKELNVSLYILLLSAYYLMLRSYAGQDDIVIGTPIANRHYSQIEHLIGFFVNSLALRIKIDSKILITEFIKSVGKMVKEGQSNQDLPFEKLVEELRIAKDTSRNPIFQVMFGVQSFGGELNTPKKNNILEIYTPDISTYNVARFDITTFIDDSESCLNGLFNYSTSLYNEAAINSFIGTYIEILKQIDNLADNKKKEQPKVSDLVYLSQSEYKKIIHKWNETDRDYPNDKTLQFLFEGQVEKTPEAIAVIYKDLHLTYRVLNERANKLANYLIRICDIKADMLVALYLERNENMLIAMLAVLKAGGAYVPIDLNYPDERVEYILKDTNTKLILTNKMYKQKLENIISLNGEATNILSIDSNFLQAELKLQSTNHESNDWNS